MAGSRSAWKTVAVSVTGLVHLSNSGENEDAVRWAVTESGDTVIALADGAGSARRGGAGARLAVDAVVDGLLAQDCQGDPEERLRQALAGARKVVAKEARSERLRPRQYACTLLAAVLTEAEVFVLQLGDGAVALKTEEGWRLACEPHRGSYAGETTFLTSPGSRKLARVGRFDEPAVESVVLMSDGLEPVALDLTTDRPHAPFFDPLAAFVRSDRPEQRIEEELRGLLEGQPLRARCGDDLTLVVATRR